MENQDNSLNEEIKQDAQPTEPKKEAKAKKAHKSINAETEKLKEELAHQKELLIRTAAEFDNYKKRTERDRFKAAEYAKASVIKQLLPTIDNANRALACDPENPDYAKGIEMIVRQLTGIVESLDLTELAKAGDKFDPQIHEAVMHIEDENAGENEIVCVLQQGYKVGDTIIRTAMVQVAN